MTTASSEADRVGQAFVQLNMRVETWIKKSDSTSTEEVIQVEMALPAFYSFLGEMEKVKANLGLFK